MRLQCILRAVLEEIKIENGVMNNVSTQPLADCQVISLLLWNLWSVTEFTRARVLILNHMNNSNVR
jgi:hypothetical protein